ncbi:toll/interleukin-1 receptor domain-containing protein [Ovoidimarina sediminis]|uniref:toll/interleukin-1 receptor domain-containing protein n=1 Tax=Ovoidimarina sediminis TaxID=3079856 RepID=UPI00290A57DF|nr:toll/interleukin-1 receptor domain-containing protein [Rhodophyticola sp. MJ-SS7]MDU8943405.1 toll/interleukin-1 receptor domain-containing protein [Rhodophyticola sp. MJ-SS7]
MAGVYGGDWVVSLKKVFVSYVRQDSKFVDRLVETLDRNEIDVWLDRNDLDPGQPWEFAIRKAIQNGWKFLSIQSAKRLAREKTEANKELSIAFEEFTKRPLDSGWLIPIRIDDSEIPDRPIGGGIHYLQLQICDFRNFKKGAARLLSVLGVDNPKGLDEPEISKGTGFQ